MEARYAPHQENAKFAPNGAGNHLAVHSDSVGVEYPI